VKLTTDAIAEAGLELLSEHGLAGLTMRAVAARLEVKAPALYWHVKNKQELLDAMATRMFLEAVDGIAMPEEGTDWEGALGEWAGRLRAAMLRYRDGARVMAGTMIEHPHMMELMEQTLHLMQQAGIRPDHTARAVAVLLHFTVGFTIEEQAHLGQDYDQNPYDSEHFDEMFDPRRYPLLGTVRSAIDMREPDQDFAFGLRIILSGIRATAPAPEA
jgi:TetR/AcrR family tetracycline transcriptional repressor